MLLPKKTAICAEGEDIPDHTPGWHPYTTIAAAAFPFYVYKPGWMLGGVAVAYSEVAANSNI